MNNETNNKMEFTNNNTAYRNWIKKEGLTIKTDYNDNKELVSGYITNGIKEVHVRRVKSGWGVSLVCNGKDTKSYRGLTFSEMVNKWDKKLTELKK